MDVSYTNAWTPDAAKTLRSARTLGKAASDRAVEKRHKYPPDDHPHAELVPFVVEARGRLGAEVVPFLKQHAPTEEPLRSAVLARALRDISFITQQGLAALILAAEPRPAAVYHTRGPPLSSHPLGATSASVRPVRASRFV